MQRTVRIVAGCLALALAPPAHAQKYRTPSRFLVRDANNAKVGTVAHAYSAGADSGPNVFQVFASIDNVPVYFMLSNNGFSCGGAAGSPLCDASQVVFASSDCSGTPLLRVPAPQLRPLTPEAIVSGPGMTLYYASQANGAVQTITINSHYPDTNSPCAPLGPSSVDVVPAANSIDLAARFTAPFHVTAR